MNALVHSLNIRRNTWHARWYRHWQSLGGKRPAYKENLCRYMRVLLIWAPLRWFFKGRIATYVPPWAAGLASSFLAFIGVAFYLWPNISLEILWKAGAILGGGIFALALILGAVYLYDRDPKTTLKVAKWATSPFWVLPYLLILGCVWVWDTYEDELRAFGQFLERRVFLGVHPLAVLVILLVMFETALGFYKNPVVAGIVVGSIIFAVCLIVVGVIVVEIIDERRRAKSFAPTTPPTRLRRTYEGVADTVKLGATYVNSKKKGSRICPFISFENS